MAENKGDLPDALVRSGLRAELMPRHVALVLDGNRRWAQARGLTTLEGYEAGAEALKKTVELSAAWGIRAITVFAFSPENFKRPQASYIASRSLISLPSIGFLRIDDISLHATQEDVNFGLELIERGIRENMDLYARYA
jgi:ditrans,polycis-polyprenyl diphosphate synthase